MTAKKSARQHARERGALDGADAQALEGALSMTERERDEVRRERDGYRELASKLAAMELERDWERRRALDFERALYNSRAMYRELEGRIRDLLRIDAGSDER